jgi:hypothetical protein
MSPARPSATRHALALAPIAISLVLTACDSPNSVAIADQPADARVFEGQTAVFEVGAADPGGVRYQWNRDGQPIPGATGARYVTPPTTGNDDGASFSVVVTRGGAEMTSQAARLAVDPPLDLRFKWVDAPWQPSWAGNGSIFASTAMVEQLGYGAIGTPLWVEGCSPPSGTCTWAFGMSSAKPGMTTTYDTNLVDSLTAGWAAALGSDAVVTALDLEAPTGLYGLSVSRTTQAGAFEPALDGTVAPADLQALATSEGAAGRVLTAVSYRDGLVWYVSHGWSLAQSAVYETRVVTTSFDGLAGAAWSLADEGYVITAAGSGDTGANGYILVGTRQQGQLAPRSLLLGGNISQVLDHAIVAVLVDFASPRAILIAER